MKAERRAPRSDGIANREKVLTAALRTLQRDPTAPMAVVAQEAGVGVGTLYRHFRDRESLLVALQIRSIGMVLALVDEVLESEGSGIDAVGDFLAGTVRHGAELFLPHHGAPVTTDPERTDSMTAVNRTAPAIPDDDPARSLTVADPDDPGVTHISLAGDNYALLITGKQTDGKYCLIDMLVPDGGGPPPHRHDFEEMFTILEGEIEFTFRGEKRTVRAGSTVNIPANAPHNFRNVSGAPAHMLCMCTPAAQDEYFLRVGDKVAGKDAPPPQLTDDEIAERRRRAMTLAPAYRTEML